MDVVFIYSPDLNFEVANLSEELELLGLAFHPSPLPDEWKINALIDDFEKGAMPGSPTAVVFLLSANAIQKVISNNINVDEHANVVVFSKGLADKEFKYSESFIKGLINLKRQNINSCAVDIVRELADPKRNINFIANQANIWQSPLYIFKRIAGFNNVVEALIDVTWSARPTKPDDLPNSLMEFFRKVFIHIGTQPLRILDFGAGKLRYTLFLLENGHTVKSVDFKSLYATPEEKKHITKAEAYGTRFEQVEYPVSFSRLTTTFDMVLLINVLNVMPEPLERHFVLYECNRKLRDGGYILWFCQYGDQDQKDRVKDNPITDGGYTLNNRGRSTFYKDYNKGEIDRLMTLHGFTREEVKHPVSGNHALLYKKIKSPLVDMGKIIANERKYILGRKAIAGKTDSNVAIADIINGESFVKFGDLIKFQLGYLQPGKADAYKFEDLAMQALEYIFQKDFASFECQYAMDEDRQRVDIKANWSSNSGVKQKIIVEHGIESGWIPIECKNYTSDPTNKEYAQLVDRCNAKYRRFGMLVCRKISNKTSVIEQCHRRFTEHNYLIIALDSDDLIYLLSLADGQEFSAITDAIGRKLSDVTDRRI